MKFAILLCVVAFACVAQATKDVDSLDKTRSSFIENVKAKLEAAKKKIDELIEKASSILREKIGQVKEKAVHLTEKLKRGANKVSEKVYGSIKKVLDTFTSNVDKLEDFARSEGIDISECTVMKENLREAALAIISNSSSCLNDKIEKGQSLLADISSKYEDALINIKGIKENAAECVKEIDGIKAAVSATSCVTVAGTKAYWALAKKVPGVAFDVSKISYLISTLPPSVAFCMSKNSIVTFYQQSKQVFGSIKTCANEKFNEVKEKIPEIPEVEIPEVPKFPNFTETPEVPEYTEVPEVPEVPELPKVPEFPEMPEYPEVPEVPDFEKILN